MIRVKSSLNWTRKRSIVKAKESSNNDYVQETLNLCPSNVTPDLNLKMMSKMNIKNLSRWRNYDSIDLVNSRFWNKRVSDYSFREKRTLMTKPISFSTEIKIRTSKLNTAKLHLTKLNLRTPKQTKDKGRDRNITEAFPFKASYQSVIKSDHFVNS